MLDRFKNNWFYLFLRFNKELVLGLKKRKIKISVLKYFPAYLKSNADKNKNSLLLELPLITVESYNFLKTILLPEMIIFEYGSGGSTLFLSKFVKEIVSVEHNRSWYDLLNSKIETSNKKIKVHYVGKNEITSKKLYEYYDYVNSINKYPTLYFDLIFIDGRARSKCVEKAMDHLKLGGYIIFDNSNREKYRQAVKLLEPWLIHRSYGPVFSTKMFCETSIYKKVIN